MKRNFNLTLIGIIFLSKLAFSQQLPIFNYNKYDRFMYNPALSGIDVDKPTVVISHKNQWTKISGHPQTTTVSFDNIVKDYNIGYSFYLYRDKTGVLSRTSGYGSYAYIVKLGKNSKLSLGLSLGFTNKGIDISAINVNQQDDPKVKDNLNGKTNFDFNAGFNLSLGGFFINFAVPQLFNTAIDYSENKNIESDAAVFNLKRFYVGVVGYEFLLNSIAKRNNLIGARLKTELTVKKGETKIMPIKLDSLRDLQLGLNIALSDSRYGSIGVGYTTNYGFSASVGINISPNLSLNYKNDIPIILETKELKNIGNVGLSHELRLIYSFDIGASRTKPANNKPNAALTREIRNIKNKQNKSIKDQKKMAEDIKDIKETLEKLKQQDLQRSIANQNQALDESRYESSDLPSKVGYYVVIGVFYYKENAISFMEKSNEIGLNAKYYYHKKQSYYKVFVDMKDTEEEAEQVINSNINGKYFGEMWVNEVSEEDLQIQN